jgi:Dolichyl-phosphate-mannose-protein mannosyltransferase
MAVKRRVSPFTDETAAASPGFPLVRVGLLLVATFLIFFRLDQRLLWVDEAETALLGRSILRHGVPTAFDGRSLISQEVGREFGPSFVWRWTPWLDKYLAAASFALLGESTFAARLPFAVIGLLCVLSVYPLALALFRDPRVGLLAMAFLSLSVPFLLNVRQCRYYSPIVLGTVWALYFLVGLGRAQRGAMPGFAASMTVLFQSNILTFAATAIALAPCALLFGFDRRAIRRAVAAAVVVVLLNAPSAYFLLLGKTEERLYGFASNLAYHAYLGARYTLPVAAVVTFLALAVILRRRHRLLDSRSARPFVALLVIPIVFLVSLSIAPWSFYRYTVGLLPLSAILCAYMCCAVLRWNWFAGAAFTATLLFTGIFHHVSAPFLQPPKYNLLSEGRSFPLLDTLFPLGNYLYEVTHTVLGPMDRLVPYLSEHARPGDRIFISYGDLVLMFYLDHEVRGGQSGRELTGWPAPDWVIIRSFFRFRDRAIHKADADRVLAWLNDEVPRQDYEEVAVPGTDFPWDNISEPDIHWYRTLEGGKPMQVYHRTTPSPATSVP